MLVWPSGLEIISRLAPVKLYGQTYFCSDTTRFWPDKCLSSKIIRLHFAVKYMRTVLIILYNTTHPTPEFAVTILYRNSRKMKNHCYRPAAQGFWNFARSQSRGIQVNLGNPAKFTKTREISRNSVEILPNTCHFNIFESFG